MFGITASPLLRVVLIVVVLVLLATLAACQVRRSAPVEAPPTPTRAAVQPPAQQGSPTVVKDDYWPTADWLTDDPAAHHVDVSRLNAMLDYIKLKGLKILGVVVIRNGYIVFEHYPGVLGPQSRGEVYSVTKSFSSTLIGIAMRKGLLTDLDAKVLALLPGSYDNVDARKQAMTLEDVLTMRSGLGWTEDDQTIGQFYTSADPMKFMLDLPMTAAPGTNFSYCTGCSHLLTSLIAKATNAKATQFAQKELLGPLGIRDAFWLPDRSGVPMGGWGLSLTAREMAKLGYLFLRGGTWDGQEIVTPEWVKAATQKHTATDSPNGYGYQWWTHPKYPAYMALGRFGQIIYVDPDKNLVVAMRADVPNHDPIYYLIDTYIEPAVK